MEPISTSSAGVGAPAEHEMRAVRAYGPLSYQLDEVPIPVPGPGQYLMQVRGVGICGSDVKMWQGADFYWRPDGRVKQRPVIPGHEFAGLIVASGEGVPMPTNPRVVSEQLIPCTECWFCARGRFNKCLNLRIYGQAIDGAMAEYVLIDANTPLHAIPDGVSYPEAVLAEPFAVSIHAFDRAGLTAEDTAVVVSGCGSVGLGVIAALRTYRPDVVIVACDTNMSRAETAVTYGASIAVGPDGLHDSMQELAGCQIREKRGFDAYFECSGSGESIINGLNSLRSCGTFAHVGISAQEGTYVDWNILSAQKELNVFGVSLGVGCWDRALDILKSGDFADLTHVIDLGDYERAFDLVKNPSDKVKIILDPVVGTNGE